MKTKKKKTVPHVVLVEHLRCLNCGVEQIVPWPIGVVMLSAMATAFSKMHEFCKPSERGRERFEFSTPDEWLESWDTGISSKTIFWAITDRHPGGRDFRPDFPYDPGDFGRCHRLVAKLGWRSRLGSVAKRFPEWAPFVDAWDELEKLYVEEIPMGKAPRLYERMQPLVAEAEAIRAREG